MQMKSACNFLPIPTEKTGKSLYHAGMTTPFVHFRPFFEKLVFPLDFPYSWQASASGTTRTVLSSLRGNSVQGRKKIFE